MVFRGEITPVQIILAYLQFDTDFLIGFLRNLHKPFFS